MNYDEAKVGSYTLPGGRPGYYDELGRSLKRFFLRSPLRFEPRITSGFSRTRFHPVLHAVRAHLGVDYGAPIGAAIGAILAPESWRTYLFSHGPAR